MKKFSFSTSNRVNQNDISENLDYFDINDSNYSYEDDYNNFNFEFYESSTNKNNKFSCNNEKCKETTEEIKQLTEECNDLEQKCILIDYSKSEELFNLSEKISLICTNVQKLIQTIENYEGESIENLKYDQLTKIELNLLTLLIKVKKKISKVL